MLSQSAVTGTRCSHPDEEEAHRLVTHMKAGAEGPFGAHEHEAPKYAIDSKS